MTGEEIKSLRNELHLTQQQFSNRLNWSASFISKIETGNRKLTAEQVRKIRTVFCLDEDSLPMEAKIDFLRIRFKIHSPKLVIEKILRMNPEVFLYKNYGFNHYTETHSFSEIFIFSNPSNIDMGTMIELRGQGCREYELILQEHNESWSEFFWRLYQTDPFGNGLTYDMKITRIDLALDELISHRQTNYDLFELKDKLELGLVDSKFRNFDFTGGIVTKGGKRFNKGLSLYFGSRQSPFYLNFYQKDFELAKKEQISVEMARQKYGLINRYEVRLSDQKAYLFVEYLLSTGESIEWIVKELIDTAIKVYDCDSKGNRVSYSRNWRRVIESMQELKLSVKPEKPNYEKALRWLSHHLAPTLKKILIMDRTFGKNELMTRIEEAELKEKDLEELDKLTTNIKDLLLKEDVSENELDKNQFQHAAEQQLARFLFK